MAHWRTLIPSEYLKASDFQGRDWKVTVAKVERKDLDKLAKPGKDVAGPKGPSQKERRGVVYFRETDKFLPLNVINAASMAAMWGDDYTRWAGHEIVLYPGRAQLGADEVDAIRVRGAPDLSAPIEFELPMPRRRPVKVRLVPTDGKAASGGQRRSEPDAPPDDRDMPPLDRNEPGADG